MKVLLIQDPNFADLSDRPQNGYYNQHNGLYSYQTNPTSGAVNYYSYDQHYTPAEISEDGLYDEQL